MGFRVPRPSIASLLVAATAFASLLPPVHIHLGTHHDHDHDHAGAVEHSHWSSHGASRAELDDDDGQAIYVDHPALTRAIDTTIVRPAAALIALLTIPAPATFVVVERTTSGNSPRDGPFRSPALLRGPPDVL